ncbi:replication restart helicase PriA [Wolbachia endosymbiont of Folsomia candida]|uniref:replication restart helicase PriA n=1 Tax=Wolbachia endosymbiont of Folsomia candida TaxID=169402 RepID=UPI000A48208B|nr:primosomal protein N' [Wolbachia endosymbiont of Folsomia candida]
MAKTVDILLPLPINQLFSYAVGENTEISIGDYVIVPFGRKRLIGIVWRYSSKSDRELKFIEQKIDLPSVRPKLIAFAEWVAEYNLILVGMLAKVIMGGVLKVSNVEKLVHTKQEREISEINYQLNSEQQAASDKIISSLNKYSVTLLDGETGSGKTEVYLSVIAKLLKDGGNAQQLSDIDGVIPVLDTGIHFACNSTVELDFSTEFDIYPLDLFANKVRWIPVSRTGMTKFGTGMTSYKTRMIPNQSEMTPGQSDAQVLILLPEIVLTSQLVNRIRNQISGNIAEWHSGLTPKTRRNNWLSIANGSAQIIIGARSALFLPYKNLKLIVIDEEHDSSFKQEQGIIYNARDMAIILAKIENIPIILSSATPLLETIYHVKNGNYNHVKLTKRFGGAELPLIKVVDMRNSKQWISNELFENIKQTIEKKQQVMLFLNRRGYAQLAVCKKCGYKIPCLNCAVWLTYHKKKNLLLCHHCSYQSTLPEKCTNCQSEGSFSLYGIGIERLLEETVKLIPSAKTAIISSDQKSVNNIIDLVLKEEVNIIIGTQIIAKGHNFPKLTLVGVINADLSLENSDLRAAERTYQLLHQVAGRSGRFNEKGTVIVQTNNPESSVIKALQHQKRDLFYEIELESRRKAQMPPFSRLIALIISGKNQIATQSAANKIVHLLHDNHFSKKQAASSLMSFQRVTLESREKEPWIPVSRTGMTKFGTGMTLDNTGMTKDPEKNPVSATCMAADKKNFEIFGPSPAAISFLNNQYRYRILLKVHNKNSLLVQKNLRNWIKKCNLNSSIIVTIDVDPVSFF